MADEEGSVEGECDSSTFYFPAAVPEKEKKKSRRRSRQLQGFLKGKQVNSKGKIMEGPESALVCAVV